MKYNRIFHILALGIILPLLVAMTATYTHATGEHITLSPNEGKIGTVIQIDGSSFDASTLIYTYFSSDEADIDDSINDEVTAYEYIGIVAIGADGSFDNPCYFIIPDKLLDGKHEEYVHGGDYYVYATYYADSKRIVAVAKFTVIDGEIELDPEEGQVGSEVEISGEGLRQGQKITVEYDGEAIDIAFGDKETDSEGKFTCTIIIPESSVGNHIITVIDESGNKPEAEFSVKPKITIAPTSAAVGDVVQVSGTGFGKRESITITVDGEQVSTTPIMIHTNQKGGFNASFIVPSRAGHGTSQVQATGSFNAAEAQLTISAGISLSPITSLTSPGHVGMKLVVKGTSFTANTVVTITYDNEDAVVATARADTYGNFSATFTIPPSVAGSYTVTATDSTNTLTSIFIMESEAPPVPTPMLPKVATTAKAEAYFDWTDVTDPSGVSYTLQVASDADLTTIVLEKSGLSDSEYTITKDEKLVPTEREAPYYWRVKATDGASNDSEWTPAGLFYVGFSWTPSWPLYLGIGLGVMLFVILGFWVRRRSTK